MSAERFRQVSAVFDVACELEGYARAAYLSEACAGDDALRAEVEELLQEDEDSAGIHPHRESAAPDTGKPATIDRYRILSTLGRGGQGTVYLAEDPRLRRKVALKVLTASAARSPAMRTRLEREAEAASKLDHPGICAVYEVGEVEGIPFIAMRYVDGEPLSAMIASAREAAAQGGDHTFLDFTASTASESDGESPSDATVSAPSTRDELMHPVRLLEKVARALHVAHEGGLIHRDIKPANILVTGKEPVIVDFGLARDEESDVQTLTETGQLMGTPSYMSAEQISGQNRLVDRRTDVYSLGVTLYECLTLKRPFEAPTREQLYLKILTTDMPDPRRLNPRIPKDLTVVLETALDKNRDRRYQTALELAEELRRVREYQPISARPIGPWTKTVRWAQRNPWIAAMLAIVIVLLSISTGVFAWQRTELETKNEALGRALNRVTAEKNRVTLLNDQRTPLFLREWADTLFPARPERIPDFEAWLRDADALLCRLPAYRAALRALESRAEPYTDVQQADHGLLVDLVAKATSLETPDGVVARVRARLSTAQSIRPRTLGDHAEAWKEALARIRANERYDKLAMTAQLGFIPLGPDPASGLEEFLHWESHERSAPLPERGEDDRVQFRQETGLVFVLIPGGTFRMGAENPGTEGELGPNLDPNAMPDEGPVHEVRLAPFLIAKHEMTKAQWRRILGNNPGFRPRALHPVEQVSWDDATEACGRVGLLLPTEAQWEYAARAGTHSIWPTGNDKSTLQGFANLADAFAKADGAPPRWVIEESLDDGHRFHAPVGTLEPNKWGLYDVSGNVWEWCRDSYRGPYGDVETGTGLHPVDSPTRVTRGGAFDLPATGVRSALRHGRRRDLRLRTIGVRPAARLE